MQVYGADEVWKQLNREHIAVARCTVERLMAWFNHHWLMEPLGYIPPAEAETLGHPPVDPGDLEG